MAPRLDTPQEVLDYRRVERALLWLDAQKGRQPRMAELARAMNTSPSHLSRLFARWAGVPPKRFLSYLTKEHAKALLRCGETTLSAAATLGLGSPSRLHDLLVTSDAISPGGLKSGGEGMTVRFGETASPFGACFVATTERGIFSMSFLDGESVEAELGALRAELPLATFDRDDEHAGDVGARAFGRGPVPEAPLSVWLRGTPFQLKVWEAVLRISPGSVASYGQVARSIDAPDAARAVGSALAANRIALLVPCHRVIRAVGDANAYRWGRDRKRLVLAWEAARADV